MSSGPAVPKDAGSSVVRSADRRRMRSSAAPECHGPHSDKDFEKQVRRKTKLQSPPRDPD
jgi:hypothetical protein